MKEILPFSRTQSGELRSKVIEALRSGGPWLGALRSWLQWHHTNYDSGIRTQDDVIGYPGGAPRQFTIREMEEIARQVAEAAVHGVYENLYHEIGYVAMMLELKMKPNEAVALRSARDILFLVTEEEKEQLRRATEEALALAKLQQDGKPS